MANMDYCKYQNTLADMIDCMRHVDALDVNEDNQLGELVEGYRGECFHPISNDELEAMVEMRDLAERLASAIEDKLAEM